MSQANFKNQRYHATAIAWRVGAFMVHAGACPGSMSQAGILHFD
jgi:hypothetical protein